MSGWAKKEFSYPAWVAFQDLFEKAFMAAAGPRDWALFYKRGPERENYTLLMTSAAAQIVGIGWENCDDYKSSEWAMLVGHADSAERYGVPSKKIGSTPHA